MSDSKLETMPAVKL